MRRVAHALSILLVLGAATSFTSSVSAQALKPKVTPDGSSTVKAHIRRGQRARDAGRWTEAHAAFKAAFEATDAASGTERERKEIAGELGLCELALHKYRDAAEHLAWSLEQRETLPLPLQLRFEEGRRRAASFVATLILAVDPPDAEVFVDGKPIGRTARTYELFVEPGQHMVRARAPGREDGFHTLRAVASAEHEVTLHLPHAAESSAKAEAPATPTPASTAPAARTEAPGPAVPWLGPARVAGIGLTTATASLGVLFMVRASASDGDLKERNSKLDALGFTPWACREPSPPSACNELAVLRRERDQFAALGTAMVVASGVVGAMTVASFFTDFSFLQSEPTGARVAFSPAATPGQIGLVAHGVW
ncbi:PEGA domain-containing protein [Sorangium sp. So ce375]|uniref:PEGA domain-containing protein n=1 Tax=Sorangium sp. So ce375 TaxID=3133306 RepID=UPI003F5CAFAA